MASEGLLPGRPRRPGPGRAALIALAISLVITAAASGVGLYALFKPPAAGGSHQPTVAYAGTRLGWAAPDFDLTDHRGARVRLSDLRGEVVVLAFLDSRCDETCPLTAFELRLTSLALLDSGDGAVFLGVNVNRNFNSVTDVSAFTETYLLHEIPKWQFLTGDHSELAEVWSAYSIEVIAQADEDDYEHTPGVFVIDRNGVLQWYVSTPLGEGVGADQWDGPPLNEILVRRIRELP